MVTPYYPRLLEAPKSSFFLFGVRGSGKSTWVKRLKQSFLEINLLQEDLYQRYMTDPALFRGVLNRAPKGSWVFVDEIQRIPGLLNEVHLAIEERKLKFILSGSSARKLKRGGANLLAGRALVKNIFPLLPEEIGAAFDLEDALQFGTIPLIYTSDPSERKDRLKAYVQTYLKEEIQAEALVRNLAGFMRFLPVAALFHGQTINVSNLARDCGVERTTVAGYLQILQDTLITFQLSPFESKLRVKERKHPKLFWVDPGMVRAARGDYGPLATEERGALFEGWVAQTLRSYQDYRGNWDEMFYWSPTESKGVEVDFVLKAGKRLTAIEAKSGTRIRPDWFKGLQAIGEHPNVKRRVLVFGGRESLRTPDGIDVLCVADFLSELQSGTVMDVS
jgi:predicted AAA+ superfamily ATPase